MLLSEDFENLLKNPVITVLADIDTTDGSVRTPLAVGLRPFTA